MGIFAVAIFVCGFITMVSGAYTASVTLILTGIGMNIAGGFLLVIDLLKQIKNK